MLKLSYILIFNAVVYIIYMVIDKVFTFLGLFSDPDLGHKLTVMPTRGDIVLISINVAISSYLGWYLIRKLKSDDI